MSEAVKEPSPLPDGAKIASYAIVRVIGRGGMGIVYEGMHEALGKRVAIKTLIAAGLQSQDVVARFVREGKAAARIRHPHVVDVFDVGVHEGTPFLVMEYLEGEDLGSLLERRALTVEEIADLMIPVASALSSAHEAGVIHRDLKPENVFITRDKGGALAPKLLDFGISKLDDAHALNLTGTNAILGTPYYMSPEQAGSSRTIDHRSDLFSLGVILYQCATRELPFKGESLFQLLGAIVHSEPPPVRSVATQVPVALEAVIVTAMQKEPARRFQTASQLGAALLPFASQRVRLAYESELATPENIATSATLVSARSPDPSLRTPLPSALSSTGQPTPLTASTNRPTEPRPSAPRGRLLWVAGAVLVALGLAMALLYRSSDAGVPTHVVEPELPAAAAAPELLGEPPGHPVAVPVPVGAAQPQAALAPAVGLPDAGVAAQVGDRAAPNAATAPASKTKVERPRVSRPASVAARTPAPDKPTLPKPSADKPSADKPSADKPSADDLFRDRK